MAGEDTEKKFQQMLDELNPSQKKAATAPVDSRISILAGPGTGKTRTLTSRVAYLIKQGVTPSNMVVMTFTNKAAKEMIERVVSVTGDSDVVKQLKIGTFHKICVRFLHKYGEKIGYPKFSIVDEDDKKLIIKELLKDASIATEMQKIGYERDGNCWVLRIGAYKKINAPGEKKLAGVISTQKNKNISVAQFTQSEGTKRTPYSIVYKAYQTHLDETGQLDFDDLLLKCVELIKAYPDAVKDVEAVLVDEFQDTNGVQLDLVNLMAQVKRNVTVVGDPDQSIYSFRNAQPENFGLFEKYYTDTQLIYLQDNYRSCQPILDHATALIKAANDRYGADRELISGVFQSAHFASPSFTEFKDEYKEIEGIVDQIDYLLKESKVFEPQDIAILSRTNMWMNKIELELNKKRIPYTITGGTKFWTRQEIRTLIDYFRVMQSGNDRVAIARTLNIPLRHFGPAFITKTLTRFPADRDLLEQLEEVAENPSGKLAKDLDIKLGRGNVENLKEYIALIKGGREALDSEHTYSQMGDILHTLNEKLQLHAFFSRNQNDEDKKARDQEKRLEHIQELKGYILGLELDDSDLDEDEEYTPLERFLLTISISTISGKASDTQNTVTLCTIHSSKGLEWPIVFMPTCVESSLKICKGDAEIAEARRVAYVACTRTKSLLYMSHPKERIEWGRKQEEVPLEMLDAVDVNKFLKKEKNKFSKLKDAQLHQYAKFLNRPCPETVKAAHPVKSFTSALDMMKIEGAANKRKGQFQSPLVNKKNSK